VVVVVVAVDVGLVIVAVVLLVALLALTSWCTAVVPLRATGLIWLCCRTGAASKVEMAVANTTAIYIRDLIIGEQTATD
jgi:hypothetical protein